MLTCRLCAADDLKLSPRSASGIYPVGEKVAWSVSGPAGVYAFEIRRNNLDQLQSGTIDLSVGSAAIQTACDEPAMLFLQLTPAGETGEKSKPIVAGAALDPTKLQPVAPRPADFDSFWEAKIDALHQVPANPVLKEAEAGVANVDYATITMDHINGTHVYGQIAKPSKAGKYPALVMFQWAGGPYPLHKDWITGYAAAGWLVLDIEPHDVLPTERQSYYDALPKELKNYNAIGNDDRDKSYFLAMYLRDYRAVDYITSRDDWDGKTLVVMGTSMGGQQSLCVAGMHPKITHLIVNEPSGCDTNGPLHGRRSGYPNFPSDNPKIMQTALYFDAVNFAPHIHAKSLVAMGFVDTVAPPVGIWTAFNQIPALKEACPMIDSPHNNLATPAQQRPFNERSAQWLDALVHGNDPMAPAQQRADVPSPRTDANSKIAHEQLLEKARKGGIDVYFVGDSITRRWGCSDPQWAEMLANWKSNFFGWNAADFGWGGDTTQNILWRLENGELDGVNPRVIVILAGTNNVGKTPGDEHKVQDITNGIRAIIDTCQRKAPNATIILTAIFPRDDNAPVVPEFNQINANIAKFSDGKKIRFLNVNDRLADPSGHLHDGMMMDGLHPTAKGYQIWADGLKPILTELLGPPAKEDHAPPPTADPSATPKH
jgi:cephalosporin-C deacetylase-like acetyl esterase/lysophospholipase L1-like esterase